MLMPVWFACLAPASAADPMQSPLIRLAALRDTPQSPVRPAPLLGPRLDAGSESGEPYRLLTQSPLPSAVEGQPGGEIILAGFLLSTPERVEEDVAREHRLEIVGRFPLQGLGKRIVRYRIPDGRAAADVVAILRADQRVASAQANLRYRLHAPATATSSAKPQGPPIGRRDVGEVSAADRKVATPARSRPQLAEAPAGGPPVAASTSRRERPLVAGTAAAMRWPTADEPFVGVGVTNR